MGMGQDRLQRIVVGFVALIVGVSLTVGAGFYLYLDRNEREDARRRVAVNRDDLAARLNGILVENIRAAAILGGDPSLRRALLSGAPADIEAANKVLDHWLAGFDTEVCYLIDRQGVVIASSNRRDADSFVGASYAFRPYFLAAIDGRPDIYPALGVTSKRRGIFFSHPVFTPAGHEPLGVAVIKVGVERLEGSFSGAPGDTAVLDGQGMVLLSNVPEWRLRPLWDATPKQQRRWAESRQFGPGPFEPLGYRRRGDRAISPTGAEFWQTAAAIPSFPGWELAILVDEAALVRGARRNTLVPGALILLLSLTLAGVGLFFSRRVNREVSLRARAEESREELIARLQSSLAQVKTLEGLLPICARCKKIRDESGSWQAVETYVHQRTDARFTHGICPECQAVLFPGVSPRP